MKRVSALLLALALMLTLSPALAAESPSSFSDVPADAWYAPYIQTCIDAGLMAGKGKGKFDPNGTVTVGELTVSLGRLSYLRENGTAELPPAPGWYYTNAKIDDVPIGELLPNWVLTGFYWAATLGGGNINTDNSYRGRTIADSWAQEADRFTLAQALHFGGFFENDPFADWDSQYDSWGGAWELNTIPYLPDTGLYEALSLCRMGILTGKDAYGTFDGYGTLTRAELAAALTRLIKPEQRVAFTPTPWPGWDGFTVTPIPLPENCDSYWLWEWGVSSNSDNYLLDGQFLHVGAYPSTVAYEDQRAGLLDKYGNWVVKPEKYEDIWSFELDGYADGWLADTTGALDCCGREFIDAKGNIVAVKPVKPGPYPFYDEETELAGYKNEDGSILVSPSYKYAYAFSEGLSPACDQNWNWGFVDEAGKIAIPFQYHYNMDETYGYGSGFGSNFLQFQDGLAVMPEQPASADGQFSRYGVINHKGNWVLPAVYDALFAPSDGKMAFVRDGKAGYVSIADGSELILPNEFLQGDIMFLSEDFYPFSEGKAAVRYEAMCYIDAEGNRLTPTLFDQAGPVVDGEAIVVLGGAPYRLSFNK